MSTKHYKELKIISDRLDVGIKRTLEYLITYYLKAEISHPGIAEIQPLQTLRKAWNIPKEQDGQPNLVSLKPVSGYEIPPEIPSSLAARINPNLTETKDTTSTGTPSWQIPSDSILKNQLEFSHNKVKDAQNCNECGAPKRQSAKYCYNCGNQVV